MNTVWIVLPVLIALMFQLGIELDRQAFAGVARRPAAVVAGLLGQLALLPLIAFGVGLAFRLPPVYFLGLCSSPAVREAVRRTSFRCWPRATWPFR